jgi:hypothetical protein
LKFSRVSVAALARLSLVRDSRQGSFVFICLSTGNDVGADNVRLSLL